jgi:hypothetical protein
MAQGENGGHWSRFSDEQLLTTAFTTDDPERLEGLVIDVPSNAQDDPIVEYSYNFLGSDHALIRCAHCRYPNHLAGIVVKTKDGKRFLVGHECGEKLYGVRFEELESDFSAAKERSQALRRMRNLQAAWPAFFGWLTALRRDLSLRLYGTTRQDFRNQMPRLWNALEGSANGALYVEEKVRDIEAEARIQERHELRLEEWNNQSATERKRMRKDGYSPPRPPQPIFITIPKQFGFVAAPSFFQNDRPPAHRIREIADSFENLHRPSIDGGRRPRYASAKGDNRIPSSDPISASSSADISTREIERLLKHHSTLFDSLEAELVRLREFTDLYQPGALALIASWATKRDFGGLYSVDGASLIFEKGDYGEQYVVTLPADYLPPSSAPLERMREMLSRY